MLDPLQPPSLAICAAQGQDAHTAHVWCSLGVEGTTKNTKKTEQITSIHKHADIQTDSCTCCTCIQNLNSNSNSSNTNNTTNTNSRHCRSHPDAPGMASPTLRQRESPPSGRLSRHGHFGNVSLLTIPRSLASNFPRAPAFTEELGCNHQEGAGETLGEVSCAKCQWTAPIQLAQLKVRSMFVYWYVR